MIFSVKYAIIIKQNDAENGIEEIDSTNFWHKHIQTIKKNFTVKIISDLTDDLLDDVENNILKKYYIDCNRQSQGDRRWD